MTRYTTRDEAIAREIIEPIEDGDATAADFNITAIADQVLGDHEAGYACQVDPDTFWTIVEDHPSRRLTWQHNTAGGWDFLIAEMIEDGDWSEVDSESIPAAEDEEPYKAAEAALRSRLGDKWERLDIDTQGS